MIDGAWIEEPATVKETVRMFFSQRFQESVQDRPRLDGVCFQAIDSHYNDMLVGRFQEDEVKWVVWNYGSDDNSKKGLPTKVVRYLLIVPRFKRLFANGDDTKDLTWHANGRNCDGMVRHPADCS